MKLYQVYDSRTDNSYLVEAETVAEVKIHIMKTYRISVAMTAKELAIHKSQLSQSKEQ